MKNSYSQSQRLRTKRFRQRTEKTPNQKGKQATKITNKGHRERKQWILRARGKTVERQEKVPAKANAKIKTKIMTKLMTKLKTKLTTKLKTKLQQS